MRRHRWGFVYEKSQCRNAHVGRVVGNLGALSRKTGQPEGADNTQKTSLGSQTKVPFGGLRVDSFGETA